MKRTLIAACAALTLFVVTAQVARAQDQPVTRYIASTSFQVPYGPERGQVLSFLTEYFLPGYQLNPHVLNFRMLNHNWGSNGSDILLVAEYATFADIEADCGQPCDDYFAQHEAPEEGEAGYAEYNAKVQAFNKYYSNHRDEIYATPMGRAVVEGQRPAQIGPAASSGN